MNINLLGKTAVKTAKRASYILDGKYRYGHGIARQYKNAEDSLCVSVTGVGLSAMILSLMPKGDKSINCIMGGVLGCFTGGAGFELHNLKSLRPAYKKIVARAKQIYNK